MTYIIIIGCLAVFAFNAYALVTDWKADFGVVTRGELVVQCLFAAILPAGFIIALLSYRGHRWRKFWGKRVL